MVKPLSCPVARIVAFGEGGSVETAVSVAPISFDNPTLDFSVMFMGRFSMPLNVG